MSEFEEKMQRSVQNAILKQIQDCRFIDHHHSMKKGVPQSIVDKAWAEIDWDFVASEIKGILQNAICSVVVESMLTEVKTDTKKVLAIDGVRQKIRATAYPKIMQALGE